MVSYWIKAASNTFENTYWLKKIELVFMTGAEDQQQCEATRNREAFNAAIKEVRETFGIEKKAKQWHIQHATQSTDLCVKSYIESCGARTMNVASQWRNKPIHQAT